MKETNEDMLWQQAKERAGFKTHLSLFVAVMAMLWAIWLFTTGTNSHPWPIYPTFGWGIGIIANYLSVYKFNHLTENEFRKLKEKSQPENL